MLHTPTTFERLKDTLAQAPRQVVKETTIKVNDEKVPVSIRQPSRCALAMLREAAKEAGDLDTKYRPTSEVGRCRYVARLTALCLFTRDGERIFLQCEIDDLASAPWLPTIEGDILAAVATTDFLSGKMARVLLVGEVMLVLVSQFRLALVLRR